MSSRYGWCMDGHHKQCPVTVPSVTDQPQAPCDCSCHQSVRTGALS